MRFWIDRVQLQKDSFLIEGELYHHICRVCKIQKGEAFELFCEGSQKYEVFLEQIFKKTALAKITAIHPVPALKKPYLNLALSLPKLAVFESLLESSVQMGVKKIQPLFSEFSFFRKKSELSQKRKTRWERILQHSLAQTGRTEAMDILEFQALSQWTAQKKDKVFVAYEGSQKALKGILSKDNSPSKALWLLLGSEGGFSFQEIEQLQKSNPQAQVFSMGQQILKVEKAALFGLSILKYHYDL